MRTKLLLFVFLVTVGFILIDLPCESKVPDIVIRQRVASVTIFVNSMDNKAITSGSGFIIDSSGIIVTNHHVVSKWLEDWTTNMLIKMENGSYIASSEVMAYDDLRDLALLKVYAKALPTMKLAKSHNSLTQGSDIFIIGSPRGLETSVSGGVVSGIRKKGDLIQITAPISPGSSGGPVFSSKGEVIGVASFSLEDGQNLNFAIPIRYVHDLLDDYKKRVPIEGLWKTGGGTVLRADTKGDQVECYIDKPSEGGVKLDYKRSRTPVFSGRLRGLNLKGVFIDKYPPPFDRCYPDGRKVAAEGYLTPDGRFLRMKYRDIRINASCSDVSEKENVFLFNKIK